MRPRLLIVASHPIQYHAPWFRALHADGRIELTVLFLSVPDASEQGVGFGRPFEWDLPLRDGYPWVRAPSAHGRIDAGWLGLRMSAATAKAELPLLLRVESNGLAAQGAVRRLKNRLIAGRASRLLPIGRANRKFYAALGLAPLLGEGVPYFVDNAFFGDRSLEFRQQRAELRARFGVPDTACCFLFAGKFIEKKRPSDILAALVRVGRDERKPVHLLMVGTGPLEKTLKAEAAERSLQVSFAGFLNQTEMPAAYTAADCLVLPSDHRETWGLVVNEAMACGLPAIVSDEVGCGPDLVTDGETGFVFRCRDIADLSARMEKAMALYSEGLTELGRAARARVVADYSVERAVEATVTATFAALARDEAARH